MRIKSLLGFFTLFGLLLVHSSCEEPVKGDLEIPRARLVIASNFYPDELVKVGVTSTFSRLQSEMSMPIKNAQVSIFASNQLLEELQFVDATENFPAYYTTEALKPEIGIDYTISVVAPGFEPVVAVSSIPPPVALNSFVLFDVDKSRDVNRDIFSFNVAIDYDDPVERGNYYNLRIYQQLENFIIAFNGDTIIESTVIQPVTFTESSDNYYTVAANYGGILFQDRPGDGPLHLNLKTEINPRRELLSNLYAELRTVSPEYYYFQQSIISDAGSSTGGSGVRPPRVVQSNVENGTGVFSGYSTYSDSILIRL